MIAIGVDPQQSDKQGKTVLALLNGSLKEELTEVIESHIKSKKNKKQGGKDLDK